MLRGLLLLALAVTTAACGTRQARTGETGRKGRIIAVTDTILDTGGTEWGWQLKTLDIAFAGGRKPLRLFIEAEVE